MKFDDSTIETVGARIAGRPSGRPSVASRARQLVTWIAELLGLDDGPYTAPCPPPRRAGVPFCYHGRRSPYRPIRETYRGR